MSEETGGVVGTVFRVHAQLTEGAEDSANERAGGGRTKIKGGQVGAESRAVLLPPAAALVQPGFSRHGPALGGAAFGEDAELQQCFGFYIGKGEGLTVSAQSMKHLLSGKAKLTHPVVHHVFGKVYGLPAHTLLEAAVVTSGQIGGDLGHGDLGVGRAQQMVGAVGAVPMGKVGCAMGDTGQVGVQCQVVVGMVDQMGHDIIRGLLNGIRIAVGQDRAVRSGGGDQIAEVHRRIPGIHRECAVVLPEGVAGRPEIHMVIQLFQSGVAVGAVAADTSGICG